MSKRGILFNNMRGKNTHRLLHVTIVSIATLIATSGIVYAQLASEKRFTVYNGVISVEGQSGSNDIIQIGNGGRDIVSTGYIYIRPGTANGAYSTPTASGSYFQGVSGNIQNLRLSGSLCLIGSGSWDCKNTWPTGGGTLDAAYRFGSAPDFGRIISVDTGVGSVEIQATGRTPLVLRSNTNEQLEFYKTGGNTQAHTLLDRSSVGFRFWDATGSQSLALLEAVSAGGSLSISQDSPVAKLVVNNPRTAGKVGTSGDAFYAYANSANAAISAEQANASGYAGYFSGQLTVVSGATNLLGGLTLGSQTGSRLNLAGKYNILSIEAESSFFAVVGPTPAACLQDNYVSPLDGNTYLRLNNCDTSTIMRSNSTITLPAGNWKAVFRVRKNNSTSNTRTTDNISFTATGVAGAVRHVTEQELDFRFSNSTNPHTFSMPIILQASTSFFLQISPDIVSDFVIDSIFIQPDTDSYSVFGDHSLTVGSSSSGGATVIDASAVGIDYTCPPGYVVVGIQNGGDAGSGARAIPICARN